METSFAVRTTFGPKIGGCLFDLGGFSLPFYGTGRLMFISVMSSLFLKDDMKEDYLNVIESSLTWTDLFQTAGVPISIFSIIFAGIATPLA